MSSGSFASVPGTKSLPLPVCGQKSLGISASHLQPSVKGERERKQEQTKFYDLRRGITEDFQRLANFQWTLSKSTKKFTDFKRFAFLTFFDL